MIKRNNARKGFSLTFRLSLGFTLLIAMLTGAVGFSVYAKDRNLFLNQAVNQGWAISESVNTVALNSLTKTGDYTLLNDMLKVMRDDGMFKEAAVIDANGRVVAYSGPKGLSVQVNVGPIADVMSSGVRKMTTVEDDDGKIKGLTFTSPIKDPYGIIRGYYNMVIDITPIQTYLDESLSSIVMYFALASVAGLLMARLIILKSVGRQVKSLLSATDKVSIGDFSYQVPVETNDELGRLAEAFNAMSRELGVLFNSIRGIVNEMNSTSEIITNRVEYIRQDEDSEIRGGRREELLKEIHSGAKRLTRMSQQLNSLALQFKTAD